VGGEVPELNAEVSTIAADTHASDAFAAAESSASRAPITAVDQVAVRVESKPARSNAANALKKPGVPRTSETSLQALAALRDRYLKDAPHAPFIKTFNNIVFGEGDPCAPLMFIGEAPGEEEDRTGRPFVGRAGQLLEKMIVAMGLSRERVYICNVLKVRPPNNATPTLEEAAASEPYLLEQIDIVAPEAIVTLGKSATACVLKLDLAMGAMRGRWHDLTLPTGRVVPVMPTFHPAYLLRAYTEENRKKVWSDLQLVVQRLDAEAVG
jgi:DNA polymerase